MAGNFSAYWLGLTIMGLMAAAYGVSTLGLSDGIMLAPAIFAFGLVAFGFLGMGPGHHRGGQLRPGHRQRAVGV